MKKSKYATVFRSIAFTAKLKVPILDIPGSSASEKLLNGYAMNLVDMTDKDLYHFMRLHMKKLRTRRGGLISVEADNLTIIRRTEEIKKKRDKAQKSTK